MPLYNPEPRPSTGVLVTDYGSIGTADDTAVFKAALDATSVAGQTLLIPPGSIVTTDTYNIPNSSAVDLQCVGGKATIKTLALNCTPAIKRDFGLNRISGFRAKNIIFQGNGKEGTEQQIVAVNWVSSGNVGSWVELASVTGYPDPNTHGVGATPAINCHKVLAGDNIRADFTYTAVNRTTKRLTGVNIDMTTAGTADNGNPETTVGYWVDDSAAKIAINLYNVDDVDITDCEFYDWFSAAMTIFNGYRRKVVHNRIERCGQSTNGRNVVSLVYDDQHPPADGAITTGYDSILDNFIKDGVQAAIYYSTNVKNGVVYGVNTPRKGIISGNFVQNMTNYSGIALEIGENDSATVSGNHLYSCLGGVNAALNGYFQSTTVPSGKQVVSSGGTLLTDIISGNIAPSGRVLVAYGNGTSSTISYTSVDSTHLYGVTPAITVYGGEVITPYDFKKKLIISNNIIDDEIMTIPTVVNTPTKYGIKCAAGHSVIEGNYIRYRGLAGGLRVQSPTGINTFAAKVSNNIVVMCGTALTNNAPGISITNISGSDIHGNTVIRENVSPSVGSMGAGLSISNTNDVDVQDNKILSPGEDGIRLTNCTNMAITGNTIVDAGSQANGTYADIAINSDCFNVRINTNKTRWSGVGAQRDYGVWVKQEGGQDISVVNNWLHDWKTAAVLDDQVLNSVGIASAGTLSSGGNLKVSSGTSVPVNGGRLVLNSVPQMYTGFYPTVTAFVNGSQTVGSGGNLVVTSTANLPDYGAITVNGVAQTYTSKNAGANTLVGLVPGGTYSGNEAVVATNVVTGITTGAVLTGSETFSITGNSIAVQYLNRYTKNATPYITNYGMKELSSSTAAPTTGTWARGDFIRNTAPSAGGTWGWVCTTAGTPGTWKAISIAA